MTEDFDAYYAWFGIRSEEQPPNHYRLLGIEPFENDPAVIHSAAEQRMVYLRTFQIGRHSALSQQLMNEVAATKAHLLNPEKKAAYDQHLRQLQRSTQAPAPPPTAAPPSAVQAPPVASNSTGEPVVTHGKIFGQSPRLIAAASIGLLAVIGLVAAAYILPGGSSSHVLTPRVNPADTSTADVPARGRASEPSEQQVVEAASAEPTRSEAAAQSPGQLATTSLAAAPASSEPEASRHPVAAAETRPANLGGPKENATEIDLGGAPEIADPAPVEPTLPPSSSGPATRLPVPPEATQTEIARRIDSVFKIADAKSRQDRLTLAEELHELGCKSVGDPDEQFVLLRRAMELAGEAGDAARMLEIVDEIGQRFEVDTLRVKLVVLEIFAKDMTSSDRVTSLIEAAQVMSNEALEASRCDLAFQLIDLAYSACSRPGGAKYRKEVFDRRKQIEELRESWQERQAAMAALSTNPDDPEANLVLARWYCLTERDWEKGLTFAAKCGDQTFRTLAEQELQLATDNAEGRSKLADGWWDYAEEKPKSEKEAIRAHAGELYRQAQPHLPAGLAKVTAERRLAELTPPEPERGPEKDETRKSTAASATQATAVAAPPGKAIPAAVETELRLPKDQGPYQLTGKVVVLKTGALLIERGATILAAPGASLVAAGRLASYGEGDEFVDFRPAATASWDKIRLDPGVQHLIQRFDVRGAAIGIELGEEVAVEVVDSIFTQNKIGISVKRSYGEKPTLKNCLVVGNLSHGITFYLCKAFLDHCTVANNGEIGLNMTYYGNVTVTSCNIAGNGTGIQSNLYETQLSMRLSNIVGNRGPAIWVRTDDDFQCPENYWGVKNAQQIAAMINDGYDEPSRGIVHYEDFKTKPIDDSGCSIELPKSRRRGR